MAQKLHMLNTLQIPKYLKTGNLVKFLSEKIRICSELSIYKDQDHSSNQLYMPEPDVQKNGHFSIWHILLVTYQKILSDVYTSLYQKAYVCSTSCLVSGSLVTYAVRPTALEPLPDVYCPRGMRLYTYCQCERRRKANNIDNF